MEAKIISFAEWKAAHPSALPYFIGAGRVLNYALFHDGQKRKRGHFWPIGWGGVKLGYSGIRHQFRGL